MLQPELQVSGQLSLAPQMQYSLSLLRMDTLSLARHIQEQAMENPLISLEAACSAPALAELAVFPDSNTASLQRFLAEQIPISFSAAQEQALLCMIELLDDRGYLSVPPAALPAMLNIPRDTADQALASLRQMDPPGVGATDLETCLAIQLDRLPNADPLAYRIAERYLSDMAAGRLRKIAHAEKVSLARIKSAADCIRTLDPFPARGFADGAPIRPILPEIRVAEKEGHLTAAFTRYGVPSLQRSKTYVQLLTHSNDPDVSTYLKEKSTAFSVLEQAVLLRTNTILAVVQVVLKRQTDFFLSGCCEPAALSPNEVGKELGLHPSTVSRAIQDKYLICDRGIFPLKYFLPRRGKVNRSVSAHPSCFQLQAALLSAIDGEEPDRPLSDEALFCLLRRQGFDLSRRSVQNWRQRLGIPNSYLRMQRYASGYSKEKDTSVF